MRNQQDEKTKRDAVPTPEDGGHSRSHAAHLGGSAHANTKPVASMQPGVNGELREPPMVTERVGKSHRKM